MHSPALRTNTEHSAGRASVTRELGLPAAPLSDLTSKNSRRSLSRASRRTTHEPDFNGSNLSQSSCSLPPTPLTSTFEETQPSVKRRKTRRSVNPEDKALPSEEPAETSERRAASEPSQAAKGSSAQSNGGHFKEENAPVDEVVTLSPSKAKLVARPEQSQATLHSFLLKKPQPRRKTQSAKKDSTEMDHNAQDVKAPTSDATTPRVRSTRKSMPALLDGAAKQEKGTAQSQTSASRRDRKSKNAAQAQANGSTPVADVKANPTPAGNSIKASKAQRNGETKPDIPDAQTHPSTPLNSTPKRRRTHKARTEDHVSQNTSVSTKGTETRTPVAVQNNDKSRSRSRRSKPRVSNTVTLTLGRKSLESVVGQNDEPISYEHEIANSVETPVHVYGDDFHFDYDSDMYRNNYGLDGQMDTPASPTSFSTANSAAARTSGRTRKPTIRALESFESEQRFRRTRGASVKAMAATQENGSAPKTRSRQRAGQKLLTMAAQPSQQPDVTAIAKQMYDLAAAVMVTEFAPVPEADKWFEELREEFEKKQSDQEAENTQLSKEKIVPTETRQNSTQPYVSEPVQASDPWTDKDGWMYSGRVNQFGEEYVIVPPEFEWYRPNNTYGDKDLPLPPLRMKSRDQLEKDRIFGFPPLIGERNIPRELPGPFLYEDIYQERAKIKAREAAQQRGIAVHRFMSLPEIEALIFQYDSTNHPPASDNATAPKSSNPPSRKRRRTEATPTANNTAESTGSIKKPKRRRHNTSESTPPAAPSPVDSPTSAKPKTLKIKLTFSNRAVAATTSNADVTPDQPRKRSHSEAEDDTPDSANPRPPKAQKHSAISHEDGDQSAGTPTTPQAAALEHKNETPDVPGSADTYTTETPGGRPRRRAAAALIAGFQSHADERARRAHARKKTTSLGHAAVESPLRQTVNPMNID
ncbi:hypothetical protein AOCH_006294 [Aspergillus ochraceoroseus]|uniref:GPI-anchored cell surface glycoprotein n=1 Tax=Aspergillus ochraceoroseus TaxID=138278 RepID=A0A0F8V2K6_9EURO|nr:hypothetical protein AOCH_006294 [Aspergillus ochraceoroseus]